MKKIINFFKNLRSLVKILNAFAVSREKIKANLIYDLQKDLEMQKRALTSLRGRIAIYRILFQERDKDYRPNFVQEFPVNWTEEKPNENFL